MKDINSSLGGGTYPAPDDTPGTIKGITVRNRGQYGRRVGIFTNEPNLVVGSKLHAGDYRHTPEEPETIIDGYQAGKTVELSGMRTYHTIFSFKASAPFHLLSTKLKHKNSRMGSAIANGILTAIAYDPATSVNDLNLGDFTLGRGFVARNHVSLTLNIAGTNHNFALDTNKHPALLTADLNYQLANVNHNLRAYVAIAKDGEFSLEQSAIWTIHLAVPTSASVKVPRTNYNVELYNPVNADGSTGLGTFQGTHLNNSLLKGLDVQRTTMTEYDMTPLADSQFATAPTVAQLVMGMKSWTNVYPNTPDWSIMHILLATDFKVLKQDTRYKIALVEISPSYVNGDLHQLISANYVKGGERTPAEFLIVGRDGDDQTYGTRLIDVERSVAQNRLVGLGEEQVQVLNDSLQYLPEKGGVNGGGDTERIFASQLAIAVVAPANAFNHTTPLYRDTTESVTLELNFKRDHVDQPPIVLEDDEFGWSKEDDDRIGVILTLDSIPNTVIDKIVATHTTGTIEEIIPDVVESNGKWEIEFRDGFSQRDLTYSQSSGHIDFRLEMTRGAANNSAATKLNWTERKGYSVILPEVLGEIELESVPKFIVDPENNDQVVFNGLIKLPDDAPVDSHQPLYYCSTGDFSAKVNGLEAPVQGGIFVKPTNFGQDAVGAFSFTITKSELSEFGPGIHTLEVQADLDLLWNSSYQLVGQVQFQIIPLIEGTEDDVTFFTPEIFDANTEQAVNTNLRIVDLDTGEVLAESTSLQGLIDDATTRDLVDVSLIYGKPEGEAPTEILCEGAEEEVTLEMTGSFKLEVGGIDYGGPYTIGELRSIALPLGIDISEVTG